MTFEGVKYVLDFWRLFKRMLIGKLRQFFSHLVEIPPDSVMQWKYRWILVTLLPCVAISFSPFVIPFSHFDFSPTNFFVFLCVICVSVVLSDICFFPPCSLCNIVFWSVIHIFVWGILCLKVHLFKFVLILGYWFCT